MAICVGALNLAQGGFSAESRVKLFIFHNSCEVCQAWIALLCSIELFRQQLSWLEGEYIALLTGHYALSFTLPLKRSSEGVRPRACTLEMNHALCDTV